MEIIIKRDGLNLHGLLEGTDKIENDAIAILMHGFKGDLGYDDSKILYALSHYLNDQGLPTIRFDFDGCGKSDGKFEDMTVYSEILDGIKILDYVRNTVKAKHIYLVGHSQGGVVASMLAGYYRDVIEKLALLAPAATLKSDALDGVCQGSTYDPTHIPETVNVSGFEVGGAYFRTAQLLPIYQTAEHYNREVLLIHGLADKVVSPDASRKFHTLLPKSELHLIPDEGHMFNGKNRPEVLKLVSEFLIK
ncbi:alpha/beta hydrolase family protein [Lactobacillus johnsonii]|uniref:alpha/beta hydrolase family protein n=1 Tax=Lactobacillus johnsonii TaxID=33959 RepID=UPI00177EDE81|nr:alpha/beta fold hydrolase [Lactobacillus johnsonii]QXL46817.1 alpha/beta fold hydrolase [Lactobacillus johnsonii]